MYTLQQDSLSLRASRRYLAEPRDDNLECGDRSRHCSTRLFAEELISAVPMFKIFVGNLGQDVAADDIRSLFERHAVIEDVALPVDEKGKLRGFAIVMIKDPQQGRLALMAARGARLHGRLLIINQARKKGKGPQRRGSRRASFRARSTGMYGVRPSGGFGGGSSTRPEGDRPERPREGDRGGRSFDRGDDRGGFSGGRGGQGPGGSRPPRPRSPDR